MDDKEPRDKKDRDLIPELFSINRAPDVDPKQKSHAMVPDETKKHDGCPTCGNEDIQSAELLEAWKDIESLKKQLIEAQAALPVSFADNKEKSNEDRRLITIPPDIDWKKRYGLIKTAYVRTRLEVSGSFGNWDYNTRKRVLEHEISTELGFTV